MIKTWQILMTIFIVLLAAGSSFGQNYQTVFEHNYVRGKGKPKLVKKFFNGYAGPAVIQLFNGNAKYNKAKRVRRSHISLNNSSIFEASNFNKKVGTLSTEVKLKQGSNVIKVLLKGKPKGMIKIVVKQDFDLIDRDRDGFIPKVGEPKGGDCNDDDDTVNPAASETCNGIDDNCDGEIDENVCVSDNCPDDPNKTEPGICGCGIPDIDADSDGYFTCQNDCIDNNPSINPGVSETCNNIDDNCDGTIDEGVTNACGTCGEVPVETCNGIDDNCDGTIDEGVTNACGTCGEVPVETCNGIDDNCDGTIDEGVTNACGTCGEVPVETCNGIDDNCDGAVDEGDVCVIDNCPDDLNKTEPGICGCGTPDIDTDNDGTFTCQNDCDDDNPEIYPGAFDIPDNGVDENCDGSDSVDPGTGLPPDPVSVAPILDPNVVTSMLDATEFLYTGTNPVQTGVEEGIIKAARIAVLRGQIHDRSGTAIPGVHITILNHNEYGQTLSREDGMFDMAVNGGGLLNLNYTKEGCLPIQRQVKVPWKDYVVLPDVVMIPLDSQATTIDLTSTEPIQIARGSVITDDDGTRQAVLMIPQGTTATITLPDGTPQNLNTLTLRATEYTVGSNGPETMPGPLPPTTDYTYAVELSSDEALTNGIRVNGTTVMFNQPISFYVDNFLGFPVGSIMPVGYYDYDMGAWIPHENGLVIGIVDITAGLANLDVDGDGFADSGIALTNLEITDTEREKLASLYSPGHSLWRVQLSHFSPFDCNMATILPPDATPPPLSLPPGAGLPGDNDCKNFGGSTIGCLDQTLSESVPVTGTPFTLNYNSYRVPGRLDKYQVEIPLSGNSVPASLESIELEVNIAGQEFRRSFPAEANQQTTFSWNGLDSYGREVKGTMPATIKVGYTYNVEYVLMQEFTRRAFALIVANGMIETGVQAREPLTIWKELGNQRVLLGGVGTSNEFAGWALSNQHYYDVVASKLYLGDGSTKDGATIETIDTVAGNGDYFDDIGLTKDLAISSDGSMYYLSSGGYVKKILPDGSSNIVAGQPYQNLCSTYNSDCDGFQATEINYGYGFEKLAIGPDDSIYIASGDSVYRISPDGISARVAGSASATEMGDGGLATEASLSAITDLAVAEDNTLYIAQPYDHVIRRVGPDGYINTVVEGYYSPWNMALGPNGGLYFVNADANAAIYRMAPDGKITREIGGVEDYSCFAGTDSCGDGGPANEASIPYAGRFAEITISKNGGIFLASSSRLRFVGVNGIINTVAGTGVSGFAGDGGNPQIALLGSLNALAIGPEDNLYLSDDRIRRIGNLTLNLAGTTRVPSGNGSELYRFDQSGRHLQTLNTLTGAVIYNFNYNEDGLLIEVVDGYGTITTIVRNMDGNATAIIAPGSQHTSLTVNAEGYLSSVTNPAGESTTLTYGFKGLLTSFSRPEGNTSLFTYDSTGRLILDKDPAGGFMAFARSVDTTGYSVTMTEALGRVTTYRVETLPTGEAFSSVTSPNGASSEVLVDTDGTRMTKYSNGTVLTMRYGPDPRFGMLTPFTKELTIELPDGTTRTTTQSRTVELADPDDLLSLIRYTNTSSQNGQVTNREYDAATRRFTTTSPEGRQTVTEIDEFGRTIRTDLGSGVYHLTAAYDQYGRLTQKAHGTQWWDYAYDERDRISSRTDAGGNAVLFSYDDADRIIQVQYPRGGVEKYDYDRNGNMVGLTMPSNDIHLLSYNENNLLSGYTPPGNSASYIQNYDLERSLVSHIMPSGKRIDNSFDSGGRWTDEIYNEAHVVYGYESGCCDQLMNLTWTPLDGGPSQSIDYSYNGKLPVEANWDGITNGKFNYTFGNDFLIDEISLQSGSDAVTTSFVRDQDQKVTGVGPFTLTRGGPAGAISSIGDGNLAMTIGYDSFARVQSRQYTVNGSALYSFNVSLNSTTGKIIQKVETEEGANHTYAYIYDSDGQLQDVLIDGTPAESYTYDVNGNRLSTSSLVSSMEATYDNQDRLTDHGGIDYWFDEDGFLISRGSDLFDYSARGELLSVTLGGMSQITYHYDGMRRRVGRTDALGNTYQYLYGNPDSPFKVTAARDHDNVLTVYHYGEDGMLFAMERAGALYYIATDQIGSPRVVANASGNTVKILRYDSFGLLIFDSDPDFDLPFGYAGGIEDKYTGLVRFGFRDYDQASGRWTARDPALYEGAQANLYTYVGNDPVSLRDPLGLWCVSASAYVGVGAGLEVCCSKGKCSICPEGGIGFGSGVGANGDDAKEDIEAAIRAEGSFDCGPASLGWGCDYSNKCGAKCDGLPGLSGSVGGADKSPVANLMNPKTGKAACQLNLKGVLKSCSSF